MRARRGETWDWSRYADQFTEEATYVEHAYGNLHGREPIRAGDGLWGYEEDADTR